MGGVSTKISGIDNFIFWGTEYGLRIFNISNPKDPILTGVYDERFWVNHIYPISGNYVYLVGSFTDPDTGELSYLHIVDISDKTKPTLVKKYSGGMPIIADFYLVDKIAYMLSYAPKKALTIYDISNPAEPVLIGEYQILGSGLYIKDQYLFTSSGEGILIFDISNPKEPVKVKTVKGMEEDESFIGSGNYLYSWSGDHLNIFEIR